MSQIVGFIIVRLHGWLDQWALGWYNPSLLQAVEWIENQRHSQNDLPDANSCIVANLANPTGDIFVRRDSLECIGVIIADIPNDKLLQRKHSGCSTDLVRGRKFRWWQMQETQFQLYCNIENLHESAADVGISRDSQRCVCLNYTAMQTMYCANWCTAGAQANVLERPPAQLHIPVRVRHLEKLSVHS